jgi:hypothetical protein
LHGVADKRARAVEGDSGCEWLVLVAVERSPGRVQSLQRDLGGIAAGAGPPPSATEKPWPYRAGGGHMGAGRPPLGATKLERYWRGRAAASSACAHSRARLALSRPASNADAMGWPHAPPAGEAANIRLRFRAKRIRTASLFGTPAAISGCSSRRPDMGRAAGVASIIAWTNFSSAGTAGSFTKSRARCRRSCQRLPLACRRTLCSAARRHSMLCRQLRGEPVSKAATGAGGGAPAGRPGPRARRA